MAVQARTLEKLRRHELFAAVEPGLLAAVLDGETQVLHFQRGDVLFSKEVFRPALGFLLRGGAVLTKAGAETPLKKLREGALFGCETLLFDASRVVGELRATCDTTVLFLSKNAVLRLMQLDSGFTFNFIRLLSTRIYLLEKRTTHFTGGDAQSRLAGYLLDAFGDYKTFELNLSMQQLAQLLDISRPSLYRAFAALQERGAIGREGRSIRLANRDLLLQSTES